MHIGSSVLVVALAAFAMACDSSVEGGGGGAGGGSGTGGGGGDAGGDAATTGSTTTGDSTASTGSGEPYPLDCAARPRCAEGQLNDEPRTECPDEAWCIYYPGCLTPVCVPPEDACAAHCGTGFCDVLASDPAELECTGPTVDGLDELTCEDLQAELDVIQACTSDDQCGRVLPGTSCGCTRDLVARTDVPVDVFEAMLAAGDDLGCFGSDCDCPEADGFACIDGACTWNYLQ